MDAPGIDAGSSAGARLGFTPRAIDALAFLSELGFRVAKRHDSLVRFESERVFLTIAQGPLDYNVDFELGRLPELNRYSLPEVVGHVAPARLRELRCQVTTVSALERCLAAIASVLAEECQELLRGDDRAYRELEAVVSEEREAETLQGEYGPTIRRADEAWERKERERAADLYESAEPALDRTRRRRLTYVRRKRLGRAGRNTAS
jgi:hypothetical protein